MSARSGERVQPVARGGPQLLVFLIRKSAEATPLRAVAPRRRSIGDAAFTLPSQLSLHGQALADVVMFTWLWPVVDTFRNFVGAEFGDVAQGVSPEEILLDEANLLERTSRSGWC